MRVDLDLKYFLDDIITSINTYFSEAVGHYEYWKKSHDRFTLLQAFENMSLAYHHFEDFKEIMEHLPMATVEKYLGFLSATPEILTEWYEIIKRDATKLAMGLK